MMSQCLAHDAEASTSRAAPPVPDIAVSQLEQGLCRPGVSCSLLDEAQAEQALWQEFCDHSTSLNNALTKCDGSTGARRSGSLR
jgi:hypothetical protein